MHLLPRGLPPAQPFAGIPATGHPFPSMGSAAAWAGRSAMVEDSPSRLRAGWPLLPLNSRALKRCLSSGGGEPSGNSPLRHERSVSVCGGKKQNKPHRFLTGFYCLRGTQGDVSEGSERLRLAAGEKGDRGAAMAGGAPLGCGKAAELEPPA